MQETFLLASVANVSENLESSIKKYTQYSYSILARQPWGRTTVEIDFATEGRPQTANVVFGPVM